MKRLLFLVSLLIVSLPASAQVYDVCALVIPGYSIINQAAIGSVKIIPGKAGAFTYICSLNLITGAQSIALIEGTGTNCATNTVGMNGGATAVTGWTFTATNPQIILTNGGNWLIKTATAGDDVCLIQSAATQASGGTRYVQQ